MSWDEFRDLLSGLSPDTALGRMVAIWALTWNRIRSTAN